LILNEDATRASQFNHSFTALCRVRQRNLPEKKGRTVVAPFFSACVLKAVDARGIRPDR